MSKTYRFEFKYQMDRRTAYFIEQEIQKFGMRPDLAAEDGNYYVTSLYYDSSDLSDYHDKAGGFPVRKKFRLRIYEPFLNNSEKIWLEIKNRFGQKNSKTRILLTKDELNSLISDGGRVLLERRWHESELAKKNEILWQLIKSGAKPKIVVRYKRKAYLSEMDSIRITFDSDLETCKKRDFGYTMLMVPVNPDKLVMEVKFAFLMPHWFKSIIQRYDLKADTYSKYEKSLEALHRYNPILR